MIGYFAHSTGTEHCHYAKLFAKSNAVRSLVFTDSYLTFPENLKVVRIDDDYENDKMFDPAHFQSPDFLRNSPVGLPNITRRNRKILEYCDNLKLKCMIIDVSVEIAVLCRVSSIPYAYVRRSTDIHDKTLQEIYKGACFLLAYYPQELEPDNTPGWIKYKTLYLGFVCEPEVQSLSPHNFDLSMEYNLIIQDKDGADLPIEKIELLADHLSDKIMMVVGSSFRVSKKSNVIFLRNRDHLTSLIKNAEIVISKGSLSTISTVLKYNKPLLLLEEFSTFAENYYDYYYKNLEKHNLATILKFNDVSDSLRRLRESWLSTFKEYQFGSFQLLWENLERYNDDIEQFAININQINQQNQDYFNSSESISSTFKIV